MVVSRESKTARRLVTAYGHLFGILMARLTNGFVKLNQRNEPLKLLRILILILFDRTKVQFLSIAIDAIRTIAAGLDISHSRYTQLGIESRFRITKRGSCWFPRVVEYERFNELRAAYWRLLIVQVLDENGFDRNVFVRKTGIHLDPQQDARIKEQIQSEEREYEADKRQRSRNRQRDIFAQAVNSHERYDTRLSLMTKLIKAQEESKNKSREISELHQAIREVQQSLDEVKKENSTLSKRNGVPEWAPSIDPEPIDDTPIEWDMG